MCAFCASGAKKDTLGSEKKVDTFAMIGKYSILTCLMLIFNLTHTQRKRGKKIIRLKKNSHLNHFLC